MAYPLRALALLGLLCAISPESAAARRTRTRDNAMASEEMNDWGLPWQKKSPPTAQEVTAMAEKLSVKAAGYAADCNSTSGSLPMQRMRCLQKQFVMLKGTRRLMASESNLAKDGDDDEASAGLQASAVATDRAFEDVCSTMPNGEYLMKLGKKAQADSAGIAKDPQGKIPLYVRTAQKLVNGNEAEQAAAKQEVDGLQTSGSTMSEAEQKQALDNAQSLVANEEPGSEKRAWLSFMRIGRQVAKPAAAQSDETALVEAGGALSGHNDLLILALVLILIFHHPATVWFPPLWMALNVVIIVYLLRLLV